MSFNRLEPKARKAEIMTAALKVATRDGFASIRRESVASEAGIAPGLVSKYWGTMVQLRRSVMREAVRTENLTVVAQGLAVGDKVAKKAPEDVRQRAIATLAAL